MTDRENATTEDSLFRGRVRVIQKKRGYRFSLDAAIIADRIVLRPSEIAVDLGTGCGIIPLILSVRAPSAHIYGIEIQKDLADLAAGNVRLNHMERTISIIHGDMKAFEAFLAPGSADVVFTNPPYRRLHSGRINPHAEKAVARHEIKARLSDVLAVAYKLLRDSGRFFMIYPAERTTGLLSGMRERRLEPKALRWIHSRKDSDAVLVIAEAVKHGRPGLKVEPPLIIYGPGGGYTDEVRRILGE